MAEAAESSAQWKPRVNPWLIAATVALAAFMEVLDTSIANVALPHIAGHLGASEDHGAWGSAVLGRKNFFLSCITLFTVASFICGLAPTLPILLIARVIQGIGGG